MIEFKKPFELFRVNADATFEFGKGVDPLVALGELSKAFMKQQQRIKQLEEMYEKEIGENDKFIGTNLQALLTRELNAAQQRIKRLEEAVEAYRTAYTSDGHIAPHDCFATGPKTGNPIEDLVACPGCWAERKFKEAKL
jgi:hypothetical protein